MDIFGIEMAEWQVWVLLGLLFFIIEIFTPAFVAACLGIGFLLGALASGIGLGYTSQLVFFSIGTAGSFFLARPFILRLGYKSAENIKTNADNLIGKIGKVQMRIGGRIDSGYVAIDGDEWKAISSTDEPISKGEKVKVLSRESIIITVEKIN